MKINSNSILILTVLFLRTVCLHAQSVAFEKTDFKVGDYTIVKSCATYKLNVQSKPENYIPKTYFKKESGNGQSEISYWCLDEKSKKADIYVCSSRKDIDDILSIATRDVDTIQICKYGLIDNVGKLILPVEYSDIYSEYRFEHLGLPVLYLHKAGKVGLYFCNSGLTVPPAYDLITPLLTKNNRMYSEGRYFVIYEKYLAGLMSRNGKVMVDPQYENIMPVRRNILLAGKDRASLVDSNLVEIIGPKYAFINDYDNGIAVVENPNKGTISIKNGDVEHMQEFIDPNHGAFLVNLRGDTLTNEFFQKLTLCNQLIIGLSLRLINGDNQYYTILDRNGKRTTTLSFQQVYSQCKQKVEGCRQGEYIPAILNCDNRDSSLPILGLTDKGWFFISETGALINEKPYLFARKGDYTIIKKTIGADERYAIVTNRGEQLVPFNYSFIVNNGSTYALVDTNYVYYTFDVSTRKLLKLPPDDLGYEPSIKQYQMSKPDIEPLSPLGNSDAVQGFIRKELLKKFPEETYSGEINVNVNTKGIITKVEIVSLKMDNETNRNDIRNELINIASNLPKYSPAWRSKTGRLINCSLTYYIRNTKYR